jgi:hypothetical protein
MSRLEPMGKIRGRLINKRTPIVPLHLILDNVLPYVRFQSLPALLDPVSRPADGGRKSREKQALFISRLELW